MAYLYQLTAYPLNDFITYNLAPSLIFNILAFSSSKTFRKDLPMKGDVKAF